MRGVPAVAAVVAVGAVAAVVAAAGVVPAADQNVERNTTIAPNLERIAIAEESFCILGSTNVNHVENRFRPNSV